MLFSTAYPSKICFRPPCVTRLVLEHRVQCLRTVRFWAKMWCSEVFEVRSGYYVTRLVLEHTVWRSQTVQFFVMFNMFEVRFWTKMWCSESSMFGHSMFVVFEVRYFGVHSKTKHHGRIGFSLYKISSWDSKFTMVQGDDKLFRHISDYIYYNYIVAFIIKYWMIVETFYVHQLCLFYLSNKHSI